MAYTPCHIIAGPLGVGKTTAILDYLRQHAASQRVGVLVNDFGPVGLDSTTLQAEAPGTKVLNVPGGCICCTMLSELPNCINRLLSEQDLDRLIIEPSGMASPAQVIDLLRGAQLQLKINLQPAVVMLNTVDFDEETFERMGYYQMFCEAADILVFNRCDQATEPKIERARQWAGKLDPPKLRVVTTSHGQLPAELFEDSGGASHGDQSADHHHHHHEHEHGHHHGHDHDHAHDHDPGVRPGGFILDSSRRFDQEVLLINLMRICYQGIEGNEILRLKGVFQTNSGWQSIEIANQEVSFRPSAHRRDNRMEWLTKPGEVAQEQILEEIDRPINRQEIAALLENG
ncbi:CobW family GTP-binding protein [Algisphaera agarilytica]|uniref:G3E family GTPase n=1 Tax=Algisphaera agarilytica TaxID=1385975 RepID=A0A7X0H9F6_9BACT|nr:GTP-binding protein [Algisphaera agarilytica]MBB6431719.1 G3E family GTPase [Algisphaera agarilytica]